MLSRIFAVAAIGTALLSGAFVGNAHALEPRVATCKSVLTSEILTLIIDKDSNSARVESYNPDTRNSIGQGATYQYKAGLGVLIMTLDGTGFFPVRDDGQISTVVFTLTGNKFPVKCTKFQRTNGAG